ncbi:MAG: MarR family winged helix-turn-helix transcriptional regulator [Anaerovoracaceae bacterium]
MRNRNDCGAMLKQIHDTLEKNANNAMREHGITMAQCGVLLLLDDTPEKQMPLKELERQLHVAQSTTAGIVSRLEQKGLVEGFGSPDDRRIKMVRITRKGMDCCAFAYRNMQETEKVLLSGLEESERDIFLRLLQKVRDTL